MYSPASRSPVDPASRPSYRSEASVCTWGRVFEVVAVCAPPEVTTPIDVATTNTVATAYRGTEAPRNFLAITPATGVYEFFMAFELTASVCRRSVAVVRCHQ